MTDGARPPALVLDGVSVARGGRTVWSHGTFTVRAGAVVGVIGPNGAGKTTMFQVALGLLPVTAGRVEVLGAPPRRGNRRIGYVPQNYTAALGDAIRARDLVTLGLTGGRFGLRRTSPAERARVDQALTWVGADGFAERRMSELSGGQQQRVAIAQAIVGRRRAAAPRRAAGQPGPAQPARDRARCSATCAASGTSRSWSWPTTSTRCCRC